MNELKAKEEQEKLKNKKANKTEDFPEMISDFG